MISADAKSIDSEKVRGNVARFSKRKNNGNYDSSDSEEMFSDENQDDLNCSYGSSKKNELPWCSLSSLNSPSLLLSISQRETPGKAIVPSTPISLVPFITKTEEGWTSDLETPQGKIVGQPDSCNRSVHVVATDDRTPKIIQNIKNVIQENDEEVVASPVPSRSNRRRRRPKRRIFTEISGELNVAEQSFQRSNSSDSETKSDSISDKVCSAQNSFSEIEMLPLKTETPNKLRLNKERVQEQSNTSTQDFFSNISFTSIDQVCLSAVHEEDKGIKELKANNDENDNKKEKMCDKTDSAKNEDKMKIADRVASIIRNRKPLRRTSDILPSKIPEEEFSKTARDLEYAQMRLNASIGSSSLPLKKRQTDKMCTTFCSLENFKVEKEQSTDGTKKSVSKGIGNKSITEIENLGDIEDFGEFSPWDQIKDWTPDDVPEKKNAANDIRTKINKTDKSEELRSECVKSHTDKCSLPITNKVISISDEKCIASMFDDFENDEKSSFVPKKFARKSLGLKPNSNDIFQSASTLSQNKEITEERHSMIKESDDGFSTAAGKSIAINPEKLKAYTKMFEDLESENIESTSSIPQKTFSKPRGMRPITPGSSLNLNLPHKNISSEKKDPKVDNDDDGFATAGGKSIAINQEQLKAYTKIFEDLDSENVENTSSIPQKTFSKPQGMRPITSGSSLNLNMPHKNISSEKKDPKVDNDDDGFATAGGKSIAINPEKLKAYTKMFEDLDSENIESTSAIPQKTFSKPRGMKPITPGSSLNLNLAYKNISSEKKDPKVDNDEVGFATAGGKAIAINEEKLQAYTKMFEDLDSGNVDAIPLKTFAKSRGMKPVTSDSSLRLPNKNAKTNTPAIPSVQKELPTLGDQIGSKSIDNDDDGFSTAGGKVIPINKEKLQAYMKMFEEINSENIESSTFMQQKLSNKSKGLKPPNSGSSTNSRFTNAGVSVSGKKNTTSAEKDLSNSVCGKGIAINEDKFQTCTKMFDEIDSESSDSVPILTKSGKKSLRLKSNATSTYSPAKQQSLSFSPNRETDMDIQVKPKEKRLSLHEEKKQIYSQLFAESELNEKVSYEKNKENAFNNKMVNSNMEPKINSEKLNFVGRFKQRCDTDSESKPRSRSFGGFSSADDEDSKAKLESGNRPLAKSLSVSQCFDPLSDSLLSKIEINDFKINEDSNGNIPEEKKAEEELSKSYGDISDTVIFESSDCSVAEDTVVIKLEPEKSLCLNLSNSSKQNKCLKKTQKLQNEDSEIIPRKIRRNLSNEKNRKNLTINEDTEEFKGFTSTEIAKSIFLNKKHELLVYMTINYPSLFITVDKKLTKIKTKSTCTSKCPQKMQPPSTKTFHASFSVEKQEKVVIANESNAKTTLVLSVDKTSPSSNEVLVVNKKAKNMKFANSASVEFSSAPNTFNNIVNEFCGEETVKEKVKVDENFLRTVISEKIMGKRKQRDSDSDTPALKKPRVGSDLQGRKLFSETDDEEDDIKVPNKKNNPVADSGHFSENQQEKDFKSPILVTKPNSVECQNRVLMKLSPDEEIELRQLCAQAEFEQDKLILSKKHNKPKPLIGSLLQLRLTNKSRRITLQEFTNGFPPKVHKDLELKEKGINPNIWSISAKNAQSYEFQLVDVVRNIRTVKDMISVDIGDDARLIFNKNNRAGVSEFSSALLASPGVDPSLIPHGWIENHYRWIIWKLASYDRMNFGIIEKPKMLTADRVLKELKYRYDREIDLAQRPALRKILEKDDVPSKRMVLCVAGIQELNAESPEKEYKVKLGIPRWRIELTDGWYSIPAIVDLAMMNYIDSGRVCAGTKLVTFGAELLNCERGCFPLEKSSEVCLKIHTNSTRRVRWDTKLGYQQNSSPIPSKLRTIDFENGGLIGEVTVAAARVYPVIYREKTLDGRSIFRNARAEEKAEQEYERLRQSKMDAIVDAEDNSYFPDEGEMGLTSTQKQKLMDQWQEKEEQKRRNETRVREEFPPRNVTPVLKIRVADGDISAILTIWGSNDDAFEDIKEGNTVSIYNGFATRRAGESQIMVNRNTFVKKEPMLKLVCPGRTLTHLSDIIAPNFDPPYCEFDTIGVVSSIGPAPYGRKNFEVVNLAYPDENATTSSYLSILFWQGVSACGYSGVFTVGSLMSCSNLEWRRNNFGNIGVAYCSGKTMFTGHPRKPHLDKAIKTLKSLVKDPASYAHQCAEEIAAELAKKPSKSNQNTPILPTFSDRRSIIGTGLNRSPMENYSPSSVDIQKRLEKLSQYGSCTSLNERSPIVLNNSSNKVNTNFRPVIRTPDTKSLPPIRKSAS